MFEDIFKSCHLAHQNPPLNLKRCKAKTHVWQGNCKITKGKRSKTHTLRLPPRLHNRRPLAVALDRLDVIPTADAQADDAQGPKDQAEGFGDAELEWRGGGLEMEGDDDGDGDDGHVDAEAEVGEECWRGRL